nr:LdpA C-terminal domain-containing domain [Oculatella sp. LEGE 06141]
MYHPLQALREGHWFKLICGASFQHLPAVRSLTLAYALAGADCIDVAANPAVIATAQDALHVARRLMNAATARGFSTPGVPLLMVSLNDGDDPHFRKAEFDSTICPGDCPRPCETICPAQAIVFERPGDGFSGVLDDRCYGCGRCLPICPIQQISTRSYVSTPAAIAPLVLEGVDAVEIHTQVGRLNDFKRLWQAIVPWVDRLKLIAISCPDGEDLIDYLWALYDLISPLPCPLIWQTDGRPMSGDIGHGATRATVKLGQKVLAAGLPGYVQLAGGTNRHTVDKLRSMGLLTHINPAAQPGSFQYAAPATQRTRYISGVAYGSYARVLLSPLLGQLEARNDQGDADALTVLSLEAVPSIPSHLEHCVDTSTIHIPVRSIALEDHPDLLWQTVSLADSLVSQLKSPMNTPDIPVHV